MIASRWGRAWADLLDDGSAAAARRLAQGSKLLRSGRVSDVRLTPGSVTGRVQGKRATPLAVEVEVRRLTDEQWTAVVAALAGQVRHRARLLAGQVPDGLASELAGAGVALLPELADLQASCGCEDPVERCMHVTAVWLAAAERLDDDPFAVLRVRGRGRERLLAEVAASRGPQRSARAADGADPGGLSPAGWLTATVDLADLEVGSAAPPRTPAPALRLLGDPPGWAGRMDAATLLTPLVQHAGDWAAALVAGNDPAAGRRSPGGPPTAGS